MVSQIACLLAGEIEIKKAANSGGLGGKDGPRSMPVRQSQIRSERRSRLNSALLLRTVPTRQWQRLFGQRPRSCVVVQIAVRRGRDPRIRVVARSLSGLLLNLWIAGLRACHPAEFGVGSKDTSSGRAKKSTPRHLFGVGNTSRSEASSLWAFSI